MRFLIISVDGRLLRPARPPRRPAPATAAPRPRWLASPVTRAAPRHMSYHRRAPTSAVSWCQPNTALMCGVWAGGASMWTPSSEGRTIPSLFITHFVYLIFKLYCYLLYNAAFEYALITIGETASFSEGFSKGLSVGSSCSHVALSCLYSYRCAASSPVASTDTCTACTGIRSDLDPAKQIM